MKQLGFQDSRTLCVVSKNTMQDIIYNSLESEPRCGEQHSLMCGVVWAPAVHGMNACPDPQLQRPPAMLQDQVLPGTPPRHCRLDFYVAIDSCEFRTSLPFSHSTSRKSETESLRSWELWYGCCSFREASTARIWLSAAGTRFITSYSYIRGQWHPEASRLQLPVNSGCLNGSADLWNSYSWLCCVRRTNGVILEKLLMWEHHRPWPQ